MSLYLFRCLFAGGQTPSQITHNSSLSIISPLKTPHEPLPKFSSIPFALVKTAASWGYRLPCGTSTWKDGTTWTNRSETSTIPCLAPRGSGLSSDVVNTGNADVSDYMVRPPSGEYML